ncbi:hypothetical protein JF550_00745 [Microbacterium esteraromaticum]|uniref:DUF3618 domain-containing protein n=1 Tax=Microbacterium esteraromaticum TaxID=57043 RepID=A0A939DT46_9MICO|nr:hypothetical protein [Microbacterium esteraromaticum]MBN8204479.1 hypothetical protein [Microbacterium esteraromaticum]MBN8414633.1 hypothetical protein [Microbacterium esteraromaticum]MBN8425105.1 hypothetical protein [Microbacterium esteraromaticum]WDH78634.1 hypothetical protein PTQ19_14120 [Microbacterium esteraromaticum]
MTNSESQHPTPLPRTAVPDGITDPVESARAELKAALAAIEVRGNFPRRIEKASQRGIVQARAFAQRNPVGAAAAVAGVAAVVGGIVWLIARAASR